MASFSPLAATRLPTLRPYASSQDGKSSRLSPCVARSSVLCSALRLSPRANNAAKTRPRVAWRPIPAGKVPHGARLAVRMSALDENLRSEAERFVEEMELQGKGLEGSEDEEEMTPEETRAALDDLSEQILALQSDINALYKDAFGGLEVEVGEEGDKQAFPDIDEAAFRDLGKQQPELLKALLKAKESSDSQGWQTFQARVNTLSLVRTRLVREQEDLEQELTDRQRSGAAALFREKYATGAAAPADGSDIGIGGPEAGTYKANIVLVSGFESFNVDLYRRAAKRLSERCPGIQLSVFSDRDIEPRRHEVEAALEAADIFFGSLLFDFDQVEWLRERVSKVPVRLVFESALELMGSTRVGTFEMDPSGKSKGPPPAVKKLLSMFSSGREEDRMVGYLSFLKVGPKLLKFIPGNKAKDLKNWLTAYGYWNQGGVDNVVEMFLYLVGQYVPGAVGEVGTNPKPVVETPPTGCLHPDYEGFFAEPHDYMRWYEREGTLRGTGAPVVAVLLYRKHVITNQYYIPRLIEEMELGGVIPLPVFINGVEAHTIVRDKLTTASEQAGIKQRTVPINPTLEKDAVEVDAIVSTIGFPLVGGPAGSMEGGRQADIAKSILTAKNVPYVIAAPLLIQDMESWSRDGIAGLQSVVLYSLPELDGAIDTVPLGGLAGNNIHMSTERVSRMVNRIKKWVDLRRSPPPDRKLAILLYGFPPGVGATGTAALLNVPKSLENLLEALRDQGYDLGEAGGAKIDGEAIVAALKAQEDQMAIMGGADAINRRGAEAEGFEAAAAQMSHTRLKELLTFPETYGPSEWGPLPFLPEPEILVNNMENQWGDLSSYRGISTSARGDFVIPGIQCGNVWIGVQPLLGVEGDPMRLLFERDLTPHPQYAAFYKWLQDEYEASAVLHFGMHGTVEWLPGSPLGNTGFSWSDALLGNLPNIYVYACNNPSESIIAKRRGYGTIVSHNVPPYGRAGLYKQLATLRELLSEYREDPKGNEGLRSTIVENLELSGLQEDIPFRVSSDGTKEMLEAETVDEVPAEEFADFAGRLNTYLQEVEGRLFSEGLHVLGQPPSDSQMEQYLSAYFDGSLPEEAVGAVAEAGADGLEAVCAKLERSFRDQGGPGAPALDVEKLEEALQIRGLLQQNTEELSSTLRALNGEFVPPAAGGDLLRDGAGVLPTGRNIHALDPYRMPSAAALKRGSAAADAILDAHRNANAGAYPETVAVNLWGLDAIKTKGESVAIALYLVGAKPVQEGTGRIARFELVPLEEMGGRPRVDVLCNMSGIFRDSFQNVVELLDDLFQRAAKADEDPERNFLRKHAAEMESKGIKNTGARLFSNPAGDYGSMVNERIGASDWESGAELGDTWASRNAFSYGRGSERGTARPEVLQSLLSTTERVVQEIDSVEYGLTDIQEYYANTGALKAAAQEARGGRSVGCSIVETFGKDPKPRELEDVLRLEYRSKLLNPKWAEAMADQGSGGAYEISQRMTAMLGWGATVSFQEDWTWSQAAETYVLDDAMAEKLRGNNPQAFTNMVKRMLEASGRGMWNADEAVLERLRSLYSELDDELEGVVRKTSS